MTNIYYVSVRGLSHENTDGTSRQEIAKSLRKGQKVNLQAEPMNEHDRWAVKVLVNNGEFLGYLPSDARDASAILKGEPISAAIHKLTGGTNWFSKTILGKKHIGVVLSISKSDPDWSRDSNLTKIAKPIDDLITQARNTEKSGDIDKAIQQYQEAVLKVEELTKTDKFASAYRRYPAPINRLSLLLEKRKEFKKALNVIQHFYSQFDPVQPDKSDISSIQKRQERLIKKLSNK
jgi:hypothetical protein